VGCSSATRGDDGHIALLPSRAVSGFVLLIEGNDMESGDGVENLLLHRQLTQQIAALLNTYFEMLIPGRH